MGYWEVLDFLEAENRFFTSKELMVALDCSYNTINKHLRKLLKLGYIFAEDDTKNRVNYNIAYKRYIAVKFLGNIKPNQLNCELSDK